MSYRENIELINKEVNVYSQLKAIESGADGLKKAVARMCEICESDNADKDEIDGLLTDLSNQMAVLTAMCDVLHYPHDEAFKSEISLRAEKIAEGLAVDFKKEDESVDKPAPEASV